MFAKRVAVLVSFAFALAIAGADDEEARELTWDDLLPEGESAPPPVVDHSSLALFDDFPVTTPQGVVDELDGELVKLPGFVVPLEVVGDKVASILLVPYFGACIHQPPPPSNQIVHVEFDEPVELESMYDPVWVTGTLGLEGHSSSLATAGYSMQGQAIEKYEY